jgi:hypothetical protein
MEQKPSILLFREVREGNQQSATIDIRDVSVVFRRKYTVGETQVFGVQFYLHSGAQVFFQCDDEKNSIQLLSNVVQIQKDLDLLAPQPTEMDRS